MLELARVVASHPESHKVDLLFLDSGRRVAGVRVLSGMAGTDVGFADLPAPAVEDPAQPYEGLPTGVRDIYAAVGNIGGTPHVLGFVYPENSQMLFGESGRMVYRHGSGFYLTIDKAGNFSMRHPNGTGVAIGDAASLSGQDHNQLWDIPVGDVQTGISFAVSNAEHGLSSAFTVSPDGTVTFGAAGEMRLTTAKLVVTGDVEVTGDVVASGISLANHTHTDPQGGDTGKPE